MCRPTNLFGIGGISPSEEVEERWDCVRTKNFDDATSEDTGEEERVVVLGRWPEDDGKGAEAGVGIGGRVGIRDDGLE